MQGSGKTKMKSLQPFCCWKFYLQNCIQNPRSLFTLQVLSLSWGMCVHIYVHTYVFIYIVWGNLDRITLLQQEPSENYSSECSQHGDGTSLPHSPSAFSSYCCSSDCLCLITKQVMSFFIYFLPCFASLLKCLYAEWKPRQWGAKHPWQLWAGWAGGS